MSCAEVGDALRCPASKFITHTLSNLTFLILLTAGTFRLGDKIYPITSTEDLISNRFDTLTYDEQLDSHRQTDRQTERKTDRQRDREAEGQAEEQLDSLLRNTFRPANVLITNIQVCIMIWILGQSL